MNERELLAQPPESYMSEPQRAFFKQLLETQREELSCQIDSEFQALRTLEYSADAADIATREEQRQWQLRQLERQKKLIDKLDAALDRLAQGTYGWCEETGEPIGIARLLLRPTATLCIEAKQRQEQRERHVRQD
ncbi:RNA polymerase-binding transcription factor DksA [Pseudomonas asuensis]|uniref:RNA polymerase-binding transcription factor DksA n=1 Tax=Pseudomonas asuensis TaxID=1825787 RepID=A0ABQ2GVG7_9PSED|nr:RNA polymerase-binding protein DksA [Pseudomonas asuensis]GGM15580.1 RNA polymerase-binding transcription factor DksA [Pseudomonas asuensis]